MSKIRKQLGRIEKMQRKVMELEDKNRRDEAISVQKDLIRNLFPDQRPANDYAMNVLHLASMQWRMGDFLGVRESCDGLRQVIKDKGSHVFHPEVLGTLTSLSSHECLLRSPGDPLVAIEIEETLAQHDIPASIRVGLINLLVLRLTDIQDSSSALAMIDGCLFKTMRELQEMGLAGQLRVCMLHYQSWKSSLSGGRIDRDLDMIEIISYVSDKELVSPCLLHPYHRILRLAIVNREDQAINLQARRVANAMKRLHETFFKKGTCHYVMTRKEFRDAFQALDVFENTPNVYRGIMLESIISALKKTKTFLKEWREDQPLFLDNDVDMDDIDDGDLVKLGICVVCYRDAKQEATPSRLPIVRMACGHVYHGGCYAKFRQECREHDVMVGCPVCVKWTGYSSSVHADVL